MELNWKEDNNLVRKIAKYFSEIHCRMVSL